MICRASLLGLVPFVILFLLFVFMCFRVCVPPALASSMAVGGRMRSALPLQAALHDDGRCHVDVLTCP